MNIQTFAQTESSTFWHMPLNELKRTMKQAVQTANRRYQNIKYDKDSWQGGVKMVNESGGRFTANTHRLTNTKPSTKLDPQTERKALIWEAKRIQQFVNRDDSTIKGARQKQKEIEKDYGGKTYNEKKREATKEIREQAKAEGRKLTKQEVDAQAEEQANEYRANATNSRESYEEETKTEVETAKSSVDSIADSYEEWMLGQRDKDEQAEADIMGEWAGILYDVNGDMPFN